MKSQRGIAIDLILYGLAAFAALGALYGIYSWIDHSWETSAGIGRGEAKKQAQWDQANRDAEAAAEVDRRESARLAAAQSAQLAAAEGAARDADSKWRAARAEAARAGQPLVVGECPAADRKLSEAPLGPGAGPPGAGITLRLTWTFVRLWDGVWTGAGGEPVFSDPGRYAEAAAGSPATPYTIDTALDNHAENADRADACRRQLNGLIDLIEKLRR